VRIAVVGGGGFIGRHLIQRLLDDGTFEITVVTRDAATASFPQSAKLEVIEWQSRSSRIVPFLDQDAIINLAGANVAGGWWTRRRKQELLDSRVMTTQRIVTALRTAHPRPRVLINASAVGYYGQRETQADETTRPGQDFLATVCKEWETVAAAASESDVRPVMARFGFVLGRDGGALQRMLPAFRRGLGGPLGNGRQWCSWVHIDDTVSAILHCLLTEGVRGPVNITAPIPVRNEELSRTLGEVLQRPARLPAPAFALRLCLGEMADLLLNGQDARPQQLVESGFLFQYEDLRSALLALAL